MPSTHHKTPPEAGPTFNVPLHVMTSPVVATKPDAKSARLKAMAMAAVRAQGILQQNWQTLMKLLMISRLLKDAR